MAIFEQTGTAHRQRSIKHIVERIEVVLHRFGEFGAQKRLQNLGIGNIRQRRGIQPVHFHKLIEYVGTQHHGVGNANHRTLEVVAHWIVFDDGVDKRQATALATERALADARGITVAVEAVFVELCHHATVFHLAILHNQVEKQLAHGWCLADVAEVVHLHHLRYRKQGARIQPTRNVVMPRMVEQRVCRNLENIVLQFLQIMNAHNLLAGGGVDDYEVAEAEVLHYGVAQVHWQLFAVFVEECAVKLLHVGGVLHIARLDDDGQIGILAPQVSRQLQACLLVFDTVAGKRHVANHAQNVVAVFVVECHRLTIVSGKHHLRTATHTHHGFVGVERLGGEALRLPQNEIIERGEYRRIEAHRVLHQQYHLNAHLRNIVVGIHFVFNQFDDCHQQVHVAQPTEHIVHSREILVLQAARHLTRKRREHHKRHIGVKSLEVFRLHEGFAHIHTRHCDNQVELLHTYGGESLIVVRHSRHTRGRRQVERHVFKENLFLHAPIFLHHKRIVGGSDEQHIGDMLTHQVVKRRVFKK